MQPLNAEVIPGLPAELPGALLNTFLQQTSAYQPLSGTYLHRSNKFFFLLNYV